MQPELGAIVGPLDQVAVLGAKGEGMAWVSACKLAGLQPRPAPTAELRDQYIDDLFKIETAWKSKLRSMWPSSRIRWYAELLAHTNEELAAVRTILQHENASMVTGIFLADPAAAKSKSSTAFGLGAVTRYSSGWEKEVQAGQLFPHWFLFHPYYGGQGLLWAWRGVWAVNRGNASAAFAMYAGEPENGAAMAQMFAGNLAKLTA